jgi:hypothetical protein
LFLREVLWSNKSRNCNVVYFSKRLPIVLKLILKALSKHAVNTGLRIPVFLKYE